MAKKKRAKIRNLFFIKRIPRFHVPADFEIPDDEDQYHQMLEWDGFISPRFWKEHNLNDYPTIKQDLSDLEEHLLPAFLEFNQKARHYQNRFYLYQWVFMGGAFITTLLGALTTYFYTWDIDGSTLTRIFGVLTALVSGSTAYFNVLSDQGNPQKRWAKTRRLAEDLRMSYFSYIAHLPPYDTDERVQKLREHVISIRRKENENG